MNNCNVLVVDDEPDIGGLVKEILEDEGFSVSIAEDAKSAQKLALSFKPDLILLDIWMPDIDGITLLKEWKEKKHVIAPVIMMSGHANIETAVEATHLGAYDFIEKPLSITKLLTTIRHALETPSLRRENLQTNYIGTYRYGPIGKSTSMSKLREHLTKIAGHSIPVLILGESGTNKESYAHYIHILSSNSNGPFISVDAEAELSKLESGYNDLTHYFEKALGGTLFIKEVSKMSLSNQSYLSHALSTKKITYAHHTKSIDLNMRIIAATCFNLKHLIHQGKFRDNLYHQLNILPVFIPPLREHYEDIPDLLDYYTSFFVETKNLPYRRFHIAAQNFLRHYNWPDNLRELRNLVQNLLILGGTEMIPVDEVEESIKNIHPQNTSSLPATLNFDLSLRGARKNFEKIYLQYQLDKANGNIKEAAISMGIERTHLYRKLKLLDIKIK